VNVEKTGLGDRLVCLTDRTPWAMGEKTLRSLRDAMIAPVVEYGAFDANPPEVPRMIDMVNGVAVINIRGVMFQYASFWDQYFGTSSYEAIGEALDYAMFAPDVKAVVLSIDSPGGQAAGCDALAAEIRAASAKKPIMAFVPGQASSAGYYLASSTKEIVVTPSSIVGSIGTLVLLYDDSKFMEMMGIKEIPVVSSVSPDKWPDITTDEGIALYQGLVDDLSEIFVADVAKYRNVTPDHVEKNFGAGWVKVGQQAVNVGMADRVGTLTEVVSKLVNGYRPRVKSVAVESEGRTMANRFEKLKTAFRQIENESDDDNPSRPPAPVAPPANTPPPVPVVNQSTLTIEQAMARIDALERDKRERDERDRIDAQARKDAEIKAENDRISAEATAWADGEIAASRAYPADKPKLIADYMVPANDDRFHPIENYSRLKVFTDQHKKIAPHKMLETIVPANKMFTMNNDPSVDDKEAREERRQRTVNRLRRQKA
jgi:signal peptide peptidase SppA